MKKRETEKNNQKNIRKKQHTNNTRNTDASCDETITKQELIKKWDSERELFNDDIAHT